MIQKRNVWITFMFTALTLCLCGCTTPGSIQTKTPSATPAVSGAATPTPSNRQPEGAIQGSTQTGDDTTSMSVPTTDTPTPTPSPSPSPTPTPIPSVPAAPVAVNTDTTTDTFLINRDYPLTSAYVPTDLVAPDIPFSFNDQTLDKRKLRLVAAEALEELYQTALSEEGLSIYGVSGYRSYDRQYDIYGKNLILKGTRHTNLYSAAPGNSEHQTGLAIDVSCESIGFDLTNNFADTPEGIWLKENCWRFGFILRYPKDKEHITGYAYEPWHIRYVGIPLAYYLYNNALTLDEYYGSPSSHTLAELEDTPLIDTSTTRFYNLYAQTLGGQLYYDTNNKPVISSKTGYPVLKKSIKNASGTTVRVNGKILYHEPVRDANGKLVLNKNGEPYYTKPYFDSEGNLWLDFSGSPVYLPPLWNANGTLARDASGNLLYTEPVTSPSGVVVITDNGTPLLKVPVRKQGELTYYADGSVVFYEPFVNPVTNELILDSATGEPLFPSEYWFVPHNTFPLPAGSITSEPEEEGSDLEDSFSTEEFENSSER